MDFHIKDAKNNITYYGYDGKYSIDYDLNGITEFKRIDFDLLRTITDYSKDKSIDFMGFDNKITPKQLFKLFNNFKFKNLDFARHLDVSGINDFNKKFSFYHIDNLVSFRDWDTSNVLDMFEAFAYNHISDITPIENWNTESVTTFEGMFRGNLIDTVSTRGEFSTHGKYEYLGFDGFPPIGYADKWKSQENEKIISTKYLRHILAKPLEERKYADKGIWVRQKNDTL